jgi:hypothetical protein
MSANNIDEALIPIARKMSHYADDILDLREAAVVGADPGRCLSCYFKLLSYSQNTGQDIVTPLRTWLEQHLEVVATDNDLKELERMPLKLDAVRMESYCRQVMSLFRADRCYQDVEYIELSLQFRDKSGSAA